MCRPCASPAYNQGITVCTKAALYTQQVLLVRCLRKTAPFTTIYEPVIRTVVNIKYLLNQSVGGWLSTVSTPLTNSYCLLNFNEIP